LAAASNESGVVDDGNFFAIRVATSSETSGIWPAILCGDMLPLVGLEWLFHVKLGFRTSSFRLTASQGSNSKDNCVKSNKDRPILSAAKM